MREDGQWQTDPTTGALRALSAGTHRLELYSDGASDGPGARTVTAHGPNRPPVVFAATDTLTADPVIPGFAVPVAELLPA